MPAYTASKHAVAGLTKELANEWAAYAERSGDISARIPAGRWGETSDIGRAVVFLASSASDHVNGHVLVVDGGWMAR